MAKSGVSTPSLFERSMQLLGLGEIFAIFSTLSKAQQMQNTSTAKLEDAQVAKAALLSAGLESDSAHLVVDTSQQQLKNLLANTGIIVNHVEVIKNPEDWINAVHVLSKNIENTNDLITALEDTRSHKKQAVQKKQSRKDLQNTIQAFFKPNDLTTAITVNFNSGSIESISIVKNDSNVLLHLHPQGKTLIFDKSELGKVAEVYNNLTQALPAKFITQYDYPKMDVKHAQTHAKDAETQKRADAYGQFSKGSTPAPGIEKKLTEVSTPEPTQPSKPGPKKGNF